MADEREKKRRRFRERELSAAPAPFSQRRQYKNPPITEAVCDFHFTPTETWDAVAPARFYDLVKHRYGGRPVNVIPEAAMAAGQLKLQIPPSIGRIRIPSLTGRELLTLGPDLMSVNVLRPYPGWEVFRDRVAEALEAYKTFSRPTTVRRIGLRYLNEIVIPQERATLTEYFTTPPKTPEDFPDFMGSIQCRIVSSYEDKPIKLAYGFASIEGPEARLAFLLDLDLIWEPSIDQAVGFDNVLPLVEELRNRERHAFELLITDDTRRLFDAEPVH